MAETPPLRLKEKYPAFAKDKAAYDVFKNASHIQPLNKEFWKTSENPAQSTVLLNHESPEFIQFINPGDLRVAEKACGECHGAEFHQMGGGDDIITQNTHMHDEPRRDALGRGRLQQRRGLCEERALRPGLQRGGRGARAAKPAQGSPTRKRTTRVSCHCFCRCRALNSASRATSFAFSKKVA